MINPALEIQFLEILGLSHLCFIQRFSDGAIDDVDFLNGPFECSCTNIPGHALHEKGLRTETKKASVYRSAARNKGLLVPQINQLATGRQPLVLFFPRFTYDFACSCFWRNVRDIFSIPWEYAERLSPGRTDLSAFGPASPSRPTVRSDPICPWYVRVLDSASFHSVL